MSCKDIVVGNLCYTADTLRRNQNTLSVVDVPASQQKQKKRRTRRKTQCAGECGLLPYNTSCSLAQSHQRTIVGGEQCITDPLRVLLSQDNSLTCQKSGCCQREYKNKKSYIAAHQDAAKLQFNDKLFYLGGHCSGLQQHCRGDDNCRIPAYEDIPLPVGVTKIQLHADGDQQDAWLFGFSERKGIYITFTLHLHYIT